MLGAEVSEGTKFQQNHEGGIPMATLVLFFKKEAIQCLSGGSEYA